MNNNFATHNRRGRLLVLENLLLIAGILTLGYYLSAKFYSSAYQSYEQYSFEKQLSGKTPSIPDYVAGTFGEKKEADQSVPSGKTVDAESLLRGVIFAPEQVSADKEWSADRLRAFKEAANPSHGSVLGRLEIPSVDLSVMLLHGTDNWTLNRAVGHIEGTALPGQPGNLGIAGHRDGFFRSLKDIPVNTVVVLTTMQGRFYYRVQAIHIVEPRDVRVLAPTRRPTLTLVTCYPFHYMGNAPQRYVVQAEMFKIQSIAEIASESQKHDSPSRTP